MTKFLADYSYDDINYEFIYISYDLIVFSARNNFLYRINKLSSNKTIFYYHYLICTLEFVQLDIW